MRLGTLLPQLSPFPPQAFLLVRVLLQCKLMIGKSAMYHHLPYKQDGSRGLKALLNVGRADCNESMHRMIKEHHALPPTPLATAILCPS